MGREGQRLPWPLTQVRSAREVQSPSAWKWGLGGSQSNSRSSERIQISRPRIRSGPSSFLGALNSGWNAPELPHPGSRDQDWDLRSRVALRGQMGRGRGLGRTPGVAGPGKKLGFSRGTPRLSKESLGWRPVDLEQGSLISLQAPGHPGGSGHQDDCEPVRVRGLDGLGVLHDLSGFSWAEGHWRTSGVT